MNMMAVKKMMVAATVSAGVYSASSADVRAKDYFVAPGGSDTNPGSKTAPFKTIQKAATLMQAGDRCLIRAGTYRETVVPSNSGKDQAPITFEAFEGE